MLLRIVLSVKHTCFLEYDGKESHGLLIQCSHAVRLRCVEVYGIPFVKGE